MSHTPGSSLPTANSPSPAADSSRSTAGPASRAADHDALERLLLAAGARPEDTLRAVHETGAAQVVRIAVDELISRCLPHPELPDTPVQFDLRHEDRTHSHVLTVSGKGVSAAPGPDPTAPMWISYELSDLVRALYGPAGARAGRTRRTELRLGRDTTDTSDPESWIRRMHPVSDAVQVVLAALEPAPPALAELALRHRTDKWGPLHWFTPHYERHFAQLRDEPVRVLEIGIGGYDRADLGGGSLRTWKRYFRRGLIHGLDIFDKTGIDEPRITTLKGDQSDPDLLRDIADTYGPFDIVIDDGSHVSRHVITALTTLFPCLRPGGLYVVEDLQWAYAPGFGGTPDDLASPRGSTGFLKTLVDGLHHEDIPHRAGRRPGYLAEHVGAVHFYRGIAFLEKAANSEGAIPPWIPRSAVPPVEDAAHTEDDAHTGDDTHTGDDAQAAADSPWPPPGNGH
ncbi:class I SAM-dependent methyltransferase [Streptomyces sp. NBC_01304]|uniref:class I SAM-dependent methyltransferase n=1 Tax=Streptomyces sp. NBC_01304 TaxID=2903818 RepID=UPI002E0F61C9|nr:hypothetical protein OG430_08630 [Streptomyces sp. NBC_01304]